MTVQYVCRLLIDLMSLPLQNFNVSFECSVAFLLVQFGDVVPPAERPRMVRLDVDQLRRLRRRPVDERYPVVRPPVVEFARIVEAEDVDVRPMDEVVRQDLLLAAGVVRSDDADVRRLATS